MTLWVLVALQEKYVLLENIKIENLVEKLILQRKEGTFDLLWEPDFHDYFLGKSLQKFLVMERGGDLGH